LRYVTYLDDIRRLYAGALSEGEFFERRIQDLKLRKEEPTMKAPDDNDLLREGKLPEDPAAGAGPAPEPPREETAEERTLREQQEAAAKAEALLNQEARKRLRPATSILDALPARWTNPPPATSTGLVQLDRVLNGGLRGGDLIALSGAAKAGKSTLAGQIAYEFAKPPEGQIALGLNATDKPRGLVVYVSVEMPEHEIVARWITREAFFLTIERRTPWMSYSAVLYGTAWRNEVTQDPMRNNAIHKTLLDAMNKVASVVGPPSLPHIFVQRAPSGTTPWDLRRIVRAAREAHAPGTPALLVVDPLQRLFAGPLGQLQG
jgi:replicative DNA helicase